MDASLRTLFQLPPEQAIRYLEAKGYSLTWNWWEMQREQHARAFTVAKLAKLDILQDIRGAVETALKEGKTERWFRKELEDTLRKKGWWGKQVDVDPVTGEAQLYQAGSRRRLQTIYRTNLQTAYMAGRQKQFDAEKARAPFVQYLAVMDSRTRPAHAALHGRVFRLDDPAWDTISPPNGFNCRCRARNLSQRELDARGLKVETDARVEERTPPGRPPVDPRTGETPADWRQRGVSIPDPLSPGDRKYLWADMGWDYNPGRSAPWGDIDLWSRVRATLPTELAAQALREHALHPSRLAAFDDWVEAVFRQDGARGLEWVIGYLAQADVDYLAGKGVQIANGAVVLDDGRLVGPKAKRHERSGDALTPDEWKQVPRQLAEPEAVLYDKENGTLLYVLPSPDGRAAKIVVEASRIEKKKPAHESVRTAFKVTRGALQAGIDGRMYDVVRGALK
ncbi:phage minor head protein [Thiocystis violascens]|uniref:Phage putative head morphogenesis protein, SPP1 gp7 family n=1 Tax=Thiocystis violascens (strain ATCC 17096 / DSM 198 / 6111) TaxID=765911 RepID=I3YGV8_THIV6|nr:phage minor head protein [Thiocystis violascens]AFL76226.1 phage putative head morphogenesis protein, SPP1 gp7 family [Thiocystis violascens DSM 198]